MAASRRCTDVPLIGFAQAGAGGYFDDGGFPVGKGWEEIAFPAVTDEHAYALEISGDFDEAGLSRRRRHHRFAGGAGATAATASWSRPRTAK